MALPLDVPERELILFLTFCVILATLVGQGLSLPFLIRRSGVLASSGPDTEETHARLAAVEAGLRRLDTLALDYPGHDELIETLCAAFDHEASHVMPPSDAPLDEAERERLERRLIRDALITAQHEAVIRLRDDGHINDETMRSIERELDLEALRADD